MTPFFVDIYASPLDAAACMRDIKGIAMGWPGDSNDLVTEVLLGSDFPESKDPGRDIVLAFRDRVLAVGGATIGRVRAPMLGVTLVGWGIRSYVWPRLALELFRQGAPLYNFACPLSRRYNDVDMADLRNIMTQGSYIPDRDDVEFSTFYLALRGPKAEHVVRYEDLWGPTADRTREKLEARIRAMADVFADYASFSGKD